MPLNLSLLCSACLHVQHILYDVFNVDHCRIIVFTWHCASGTLRRATSCYNIFKKIFGTMHLVNRTDTLCKLTHKLGIYLVYILLLNPLHHSTAQCTSLGSAVFSYTSLRGCGMLLVGIDTPIDCGATGRGRGACVGRGRWPRGVLGRKRGLHSGLVRGKAA